MGFKSVFLFVLAAAAVVELAFLASGSVAFAIDEYTYMDAARAFAAGDYAAAPEVARFPLFPFLLSPFASGGAAGLEVAGRLLNLAFALAGVLLAVLLARDLYGESAGWLAGVLLASNPIYLALAGKTLTEPLFTLLFLSFALLAVKSREKPWMLAAAMGAFALAFQVRYTALVFPLLLLALLWREGRLRKSLPQLALGVVVAVVLLLPFALLSSQLTGSPFGLIESFWGSQARVDASFFSLPDKIPSNILAVVFVLCAAAPFFAAALFSNSLRLSRRGVFEPLLFAFGFALALELYALFNFALLRYVAVVVPFAAVFAAGWVASNSQKQLLGRPLSFWVMAACVLNLLLAVGGLAFVNLFYGKHVDYRAAGLFMAGNCESVFTNVPGVAKHYVSGVASHLPSEFASPPDCIADSSFDAWNYRGAFGGDGYREVFVHGGVTVFKRVPDA